MLDKDEFYQLKEELAPMLGKVLLGKLVDEEFNQVDRDHSGTIDQKEFLLAYQKIFTPTLKANISVEGTNVLEIFNQYVEAQTLHEVLRKYEELKEICGFSPKKSPSLFELLKQRTENDVQTSILWKLLTKKKHQLEYKSKNMDKCHLLIVGAGPSGLRLAIEASFLGANVTVIEKRRKFSRNNVSLFSKLLLLTFLPNTIKSYYTFGLLLFVT